MSRSDHIRSSDEAEADAKERRERKRQRKEERRAQKASQSQAEIVKENEVDASSSKEASHREREDDELEREGKERKRKRKEEKRLQKATQVQAEVVEENVVDASSSKEALHSEREDDELEKERKERKRKKKEERRGLKSIQDQAELMQDDIVHASSRKGAPLRENEAQELEEQSKEERRRAKKLKKLQKRKRELDLILEEVTAVHPEERDPSEEERQLTAVQAEPPSPRLDAQSDADDTGKRKKQKKKKKKDKEKSKAEQAVNAEAAEPLSAKIVNDQTSERPRLDEEDDSPTKPSKGERKRAKELRRQKKEEEKKKAIGADPLPLPSSSGSETSSPSREIVSFPDSSPVKSNVVTPGASASPSTHKALEPPLASQQAVSASPDNQAPLPAPPQADVPRPARKRNISAMIDAALRKKVTGGSLGLRKVKRADEPDEIDDSVEGMGSSLNTKESVLADAQFLTHKQMLVDKLYRSHQLKWLQEARGLKIKNGAFSSWEQDQMQEAIRAFKEEHGMTHDDLTGWINANKTDRDNKSMYTLFWKKVTASIEDRSNRTVRVFVRRMMMPKTLGAWSEEEMGKLSSALAQYGPSWSEVSKAVGTRTAEDCRLRWRDYSDEGKEARKKGAFSKQEEQALREMVIKVCQEDSIDCNSTSAVIPWKSVAARLGGTRRANTYPSKWQSLQAAAHKEVKPDDSTASEIFTEASWTNDDTQTLLDHFSKQSRALDRDDFTEVNLASLRSQDWPVETAAMRRHWKRLVSKYAGSEEYKSNFRANLEKVKEAFASGAVSGEKTRRRRRRSSQDTEGSIGGIKRKRLYCDYNDDEDMIESSEEV